MFRTPLYSNTDIVSLSNVEANLYNSVNESALRKLSTGPKRFLMYLGRLFNKT